MSKLRGLSVLMGITILALTGFQFYWLRQNYKREEGSLEIKTEMAFRQAIMQLQVSKLKLDSGMWQGPGGKLKIMLDQKKGHDVKIRVDEREGVISALNVIRTKLKDSVKISSRGNKGVMIMNQEISLPPDTMNFVRAIPARGPKENVISFLYNVDSLQDSLRLAEIDSAFSKAIATEKIKVPFSVIRMDSAFTEGPPRFNEMTVGFANPVTYRLQLGNPFPYLLKRIAQPILFSVLLLGITILSFILLYRNLLRQKKLAALKNEFISNITHELKTPIATVGVAIEALKNFNAIDDPKKTKEYLDISQNELQRLSLLVDKVLKLSMFERKELELKYETLDLHELVEEVTASLKLQLEKKKAMVSVQQEGNTHLSGDRLHLLSVIFNLLDNAIKYSKEALQVAIRLREKGDNVELSVADNGIGIEADYKDKVFEKFFRVPQGDTHNAKGYGLGLSYVAEVVQKHKGNIHLESQPGSGTTFIITLPKQS